MKKTHNQHKHTMPHTVHKLIIIIYTVHKNNSISYQQGQDSIFRQCIHIYLYRNIIRYRSYDYDQNIVNLDPEYNFTSYEV